MAVAAMLAATLLMATAPSAPAFATIASDEAAALVKINSERGRLGLPKFLTNSSVRALAHQWALELTSLHVTGSTHDVAMVILPEDAVTGEAPQLEVRADHVYRYPGAASSRAEDVADILTPSGQTDAHVTWKTRKFSHAAVGIVQKGRTSHAILALANYPECYPQFIQSAQPTIIGTGRAGDVLTASPGAWTPGSLQFTYTWKADGVVVGRSRTFVPTADLVGVPISVAVEGSRRCYVGPAPRVSAGKVISAGVRPVILGDHNIGKTLTVDPGTWARNDLTFSYQWLRNGRVIVGATNNEYEIPDSDRGAALTARVTAQAVDYSQSRVALARGSVGDPMPQSLPQPTISGSPRFDAVLIAEPGGWQAVADSIRYQWRIDGARVKGATSASFRVPYRAKGKRLTVTVTGVKTGFASQSRESQPTEPISLGRFEPGSFDGYVFGQPHVDSVLTATDSYPADATNPLLGRRSVVLSYRWLRNGVPISEATSFRYRLQPADIGSEISVEQVARRRGYEPFSFSSSAVTVTG